MQFYCQLFLALPYSKLTLPTSFAVSGNLDRSDLNTRFSYQTRVYGLFEPKCQVQSVLLSKPMCGGVKTEDTGREIRDGEWVMVVTFGNRPPNLHGS